MTDPMQTAIEVLARALFDMKNTVNVFGPWEADVSNIIRTPFRDKARALLAKIEPLIRTPDPLLAEMAEALRAAKEAWIAHETARTTQDHHAAVARIRFALGIEELEND